MKVVIHSDARIWGGNEKWLLLVGTGLAARGHEVIVSCRQDGPVEQRARDKGLRVTSVRPGGDGDLPRALRFAWMLRRERPDALLLSAFKRVFWAGWAARRARIPRVVERLGFEQGLPDRWKYRHAFRHYVDALIVNSTAIRQLWVDSAPWFPRDELHVVFNGVRPPAPRDATIRDELRLPPSTMILAAAGRFERRKGFDLLIEAFGRSGLSGAHLVIAGEGADQAQLRARADALGIADRIHWLGFRRDLDHVLLGADLFVLPSRREGMANVMLEAMAAGCLVVASAASGVHDALGARDGRREAGWIVPVEDVPALAVALGTAGRMLRERPDEARAIRDEQRYRVDHWFSPERAIADTEAVLNRRTP